MSSCLSLPRQPRYFIKDVRKSGENQFIVWLGRRPCTARWAATESRGVQGSTASWLLIFPPEYLLHTRSHFRELQIITKTPPFAFPYRTEFSRSVFFSFLFGRSGDRGICIAARLIIRFVLVVSPLYWIGGDQFPCVCRSVIFIDWALDQVRHVVTVTMDAFQHRCWRRRGVLDRTYYISHCESPDTMRWDR